MPRPHRPEPSPAVLPVTLVLVVPTVALAVVIAFYGLGVVFDALPVATVCRRSCGIGLGFAWVITCAVAAIIGVGVVVPICVVRLRRGSGWTRGLGLLGVSFGAVLLLTAAALVSVWYLAG